jgi:hypothetical protein
MTHYTLMGCRQAEMLFFRKGGSEPIEPDPVSIGVGMGSRLQQCHSLYASQFIYFCEEQP